MRVFFHVSICPSSNTLYSALSFPSLGCQSKGQHNRAREPSQKQSHPEAKHIAKMYTETCDVSGYPAKEATRGPGLAPPSEEKGRQLMWERDCTNPHRLQVFSFPQSQEIMVGALDHSICSSLLQWDVPAALLLFRSPGSPSVWGVHTRLSENIWCLISWL